MKHAAENYDFHKMQSLLNVPEIVFRPEIFSKIFETVRVGVNLGF